MKNRTNTLVSIVDYGIGNLSNIQRAFNNIGVNSIITSKPKEIMNSSHLLLPGVGAFEEGMTNLKNQNLVETVLEFSQSGRPVLGICLGMQLLLSFSYEGGKHSGLNLIKGEVTLLKKTIDIKIPNIGWNKLIKNSHIDSDDLLLRGISQDSYMYFLHSYQVQVEDSKDILSSTIFGDNNFCSTIRRDNIFGCQYHPELSAENGLKILQNFINI
jgi:imidazole glycerol-phosphate synthase subunit HisH